MIYFTKHFGTFQDDYARQISLYKIHVKLLNTESVPLLERVKYLSRRLTVVPVVGALLADTKENLDGWLSANLVREK